MSNTDFTQTPARVDELVSAVNELQDESDVLRVNAATVARIKEIQDQRLQEIRASFSVGQRVRTNSLTKPRTLQGLTGTVAAPPGEKQVSVKLDDPVKAGRYVSPDGIARIGFGALEVINDAQDNAQPSGR
ncbi:MAG TPA: hypothetical protein VGL57_13430 [Solirubrobacteraceae bacterium]|jgi:hypothetical protein